MGSDTCQGTGRVPDHAFVDPSTDAWDAWEGIEDTYVAQEQARYMAACIGRINREYMRKGA